MDDRRPLIRVLLQQNSVAHYRARLFECLREQADVDFEFVADARSVTRHVPTAAETGRSLRFVSCPVWHLRLRDSLELTFQPGALGRLLLGEFDVAIALGSPYSLTTWLMLLLGPLVGTRVLLWTHGLLGPETGPKWWLRSLLYRASAGLLLYGENARRLLVAQGLSRLDMFVVRNSLDPDEQTRAAAALQSGPTQELRDRLGLRSQDRVLVFIGRLQPVKRLDWIVRAVAALGARGRTVHALFVGDGDERQTLGRLASDEGVLHLVHFEGACYKESAIARYFAVSDLCVIPSGAGLTVVHAMGYGTPVVTHDRPDRQFPEVEAIVPGETGALFREGDFDDFVQVLEDALFPLALKERAGSACRERIAADFHPAVQARRMTAAARWAATREHP